MLTIRFFRTGKKHQPFFKIVVTDKKRAPKAGRFVEDVGFYNPLTKEKNLKSERIKYWLSKGAQPSDTVHNLLIAQKIIAGKKIAKHKKSKKEEKKEEKPAEVKPKEEEKPIKEKPAEKEEKKEPEKELDKKTKEE